MAKTTLEKLVILRNELSDKAPRTLLSTTLCDRMYEKHHKERCLTSPKILQQFVLANIEYWISTNDSETREFIDSVWDEAQWRIDNLLKDDF